MKIAYTLSSLLCKLTLGVHSRTWLYLHLLHNLCSFISSAFHNFVFMYTQADDVSVANRYISLLLRTLTWRPAIVTENFTSFSFNFSRRMLGQNFKTGYDCSLLSSLVTVTPCGLGQIVMKQLKIKCINVKCYISICLYKTAHRNRTLNYWIGRRIL